jgi:hypothetical protein
LALIIAVPGCVIAAKWQITRAEGGNDLSYFYSVLWPAFAILAVYFWWMLLHTDFEEVGLRGMRNNAVRTEVAMPVEYSVAVESVVTASEDEDPELAAYNARLANLAASGTKKTWRHTADVVARRPQ